jgi:acetyl esterase/lipase
MILASIGYVVVEPDYLGLGDGPGLHPYQHAATEASASIDMLRSAREFCDSAGIKRNNQLFLMGYSEGGHASIATHRAIQEQLNGEFTVTASVGMSGAYDMSGVMINRMLSDSTYSQPGYLADLVVSWNPIYHLYDSIQQAFVAPYDTTIPPLLDGTHGNGDLDNAMPNVPKRAFTSSELDTFLNDPNSVLRLALKANDDFDWTPMCPTRLFFCMADTYVPYMNSVVAINKMKQNGCPDCDTVDINPDLDHVPCATYSILNAKLFFDNYRIVDCTVDTTADTTVVTTAIKEIKNQPMISIYPNPARDMFNIEVYNADETIAAAMYDATGRKVQDISLHGGINTVSTESIATGIYALKITDNSGILKISRVTVEK